MKLVKKLIGIGNTGPYICKNCILPPKLNYGSFEEVKYLNDLD
jgi:hypothetical protein